MNNSFNIATVQSLFRKRYKRAIACYAVALSVIIISCAIFVLSAVHYHMDLHIMYSVCLPIAIAALYLGIQLVANINYYIDINAINDTMHTIVQPDEIIPAGGICMAVAHVDYKTEVRMHFPKKYLSLCQEPVQFHFIELNTCGFAWMEKQDGTFALAADAYCWRMPQQH